MKRLAPLLAVLVALAGCGDSTPPAPPPTVRLAAIAGRPAAGYFRVAIHGDRGALLSVSSPQAARIEIHETMMAGTMASMRPLARIAVRNGEELVFAPGGRHLMIYGIDPALRPGGQMILILHFERGAPETMTAIATAAGG